MTGYRLSLKFNNFTVSFPSMLLDRSHLILVIYQHLVCQFGLNSEYLLLISVSQPMTYSLESRVLEWEI